MRIIYIAGDGRSGSTLLDTIIGNAANTISVGECNRFWIRMHQKETLCGCKKKIEECELWSAVNQNLNNLFPELNLEDVIEKVRYVLLFKNRNKIPRLTEDPEWKTFCEFIIAFYKSISLISKKDIIIDSSKSANWAYFLKSLNFCSIHIIHLERELLGVANSWKKNVQLPEYYDKVVMMPKKSNYLIIYSWLKAKYLANRLKGRLDYYFIRYESLCKETEVYLTRLENFLKISIPRKDLKIPFSHAIGGNPFRNINSDITIKVDKSFKNIKGTDNILFTAVNSMANMFLR